MIALNMIYQLMEGFGPSDQYLGANVDNEQLEDGQVVWSTNCIDYLKITIGNVNNSLGVDNTEFNNYGDMHMP